MWIIGIKMKSINVRVKSVNVEVQKVYPMWMWKLGRKLIESMKFKMYHWYGCVSEI